MTKKFLVSLAAVAALSTSAMAYDIGNATELNWSDDYNTEFTVSKTTSASGQALLFPAFGVGNGWSTTIKIINPNSTATVAKIVFYDKTDSKELKDINIYLSANDVWEGKIVEEDGKYYIVSSDGSIAQTNELFSPMAGPDNQFKVELTGLSGHLGYIEVIGMVGSDKGYDNNHAQLRSDYLSLVAKRYAAGDTTDIGRILNTVGHNDKWYAPDVDITKLDANWKSPNTITGVVTLQNDNLHAQLVEQPVGFSYPGNDTLVYAPGEVATLADTTLYKNDNGKVEYKLADLLKEYNNMMATEAYLPYDESIKVKNNVPVIISPFKRQMVQTACYDNKYTDALGTHIDDKKAKDALQGYFVGVQCNVDDTTTYTSNYGYFETLIDVYNNDENMITPNTSPYKGATLQFNDELALGIDPTPASVLYSDMNTIIDTHPDFANGFLHLRPLNNTHFSGFIYQWLGSYVNGQAVISNVKPYTK